MNIYEKAVSAKEIPPPPIGIRRESSLEKVSRVIQDFESVGDEEAILMLALASGHPEWKEELFGQVRLYKPHVENPEQIFLKIESAIAKNIPLDDAPFEEEVEQWNQDLPEVNRRIERLLSFFGPKGTSGFERVTIIPSNSMLVEKSGRSFHVGKEILIMSRTGELENVEHEFLHGIINPITEDLWPTFTNEDKESIKQLANRGLVTHYETSKSILNEELIRTYNDHFKVGRQPRTLEEFKELLSEFSEKQFKNLQKSEKDALVQMGINSLTELRDRAEEYYEIYIKDELKTRIYDLYTRFRSEREIDPLLGFEDFFKKNFRTLFHK